MAPEQNYTHLRRKFIVSSISSFLSLLQWHSTHSIFLWTWISCSSPNKPHTFLLFCFAQPFLFIWISLFESVRYRSSLVAHLWSHLFQWCFPDVFNWILSLFGTLLFFPPFLWQIHFVLIIAVCKLPKGRGYILFLCTDLSWIQPCYPRCLHFIQVFV